MKRFALYVTIAAALLLRLPGIRWGLPPVTAEVRASGLRSSYAFDEDDIISGVAKAAVARLDFDPHEYHWGTLHSTAVLFALDGAQAAGVFRSPWRTAYYNLVEGDFERVYVVGRLVAVAATLLAICLLFRFRYEFAGVFAAMLVAVSPSYVLQSNQVRVDATMTALLILTLLAALRTTRRRRPGQFLAVGVAGGLAIAAKYAAITAVGATSLAALVAARFPKFSLPAVAGGMFLGFIAGGPYVVVKPRAFYEEISRYMSVNAQVATDYAIPAGRLLTIHAENLVRFSMGPVAVLLAIAGLLWMLRRREPDHLIVVAAIVGYSAILLPLRWPLIRYHLPLTVLLGLCAGVALELLPTAWRYAVAAAALLMPLAGSLAQLHYMLAPHPANIILRQIVGTAPPGAVVARLSRESPPLDEKVYPFQRNVLMDDLTRDPPPWILTTDLTDYPYRESTLALLGSSYERVAHAETARILGWATFGEDRAPHDWKYTHASFTLYRKKSP